MDVADRGRGPTCRGNAARNCFADPAERFRVSDTMPLWSVASVKVTDRGSGGRGGGIQLFTLRLDSM